MQCWKSSTKGMHVGWTVCWSLVLLSLKSEMYDGKATELTWVLLVYPVGHLRIVRDRSVCTFGVLMSKSSGIAQPALQTSSHSMKQQCDTSLFLSVVRGNTVITVSLDMIQLGEKKNRHELCGTLLPFRFSGRWWYDVCDFYFFFQWKSGSYLLKKGLFLVLVRLKSSRDKGICHWYKAMLC